MAKINGSKILPPIIFRGGKVASRANAATARAAAGGRSQLEVPFNTLATEQRKVLVDLSSVSFLASYGIRVLLVGAKILDGKNGKLVLSCPDPSVAKVLKMAGVDQVIPIFDSESAAIAALK